MNKRLFDWALEYIDQSTKIKEYSIDLSELTIIVPTYKRSDYAIRTMAYWSRQSAFVSIMDGSPEALPNGLLEVIGGIKNISYNHAPISLPDRIRLAIASTKTKYVMCLADDDFYLPSGLAFAMQVLEGSKYAKACMGQSVGLDLYNNLRPYFFSYGESLKGYSVEGEAVAERMQNGICNYRSAAFYAVYKTKEFEKIWSDIQRSSCPEQIEYEQAIRTYLAGALVTSPEIYWVRSFECDPVPSPIDGARSINFSSWFCASVYERERTEFIDRLTRSLRINTSLSEFEARALLLDLCNHIVAGSHVGLAGPPPAFAVTVTWLKMLPSQGRTSGFIDKLRHSKIGVRLRAQLLYFSRRKIESSNPSLAGAHGEAAAILIFVGQFLSVLGCDTNTFRSCKN